MSLFSIALYVLAGIGALSLVIFFTILGFSYFLEIIDFDPG